MIIGSGIAHHCPSRFLHWIGPLTIISGLYGIAFARCFLEVHPDRDLVILESDASIGGTWSKGQCLPRR